MTAERLVVLGTGFAAFRLLRRLPRQAFTATVISPRNHFLYTPLLPSTAVGTIEYRTIIESVRRYCPSVRFHLAHALQIDPAKRVVICRGVEGGDTWEQPYDRLVIAVGAVTNTFGVPGAREHTLFLKELADARCVRERLIGNLERAALPHTSETERRRLLHCIAIGAGPTGVRFAAELYDLLRRDIRRIYPELAARIQVTLLDAGKTILGAYDALLQEHVLRTFRQRGIQVRLGSPVAEVTTNEVRLRDGESLPAGLVLWAAGFGPNPFVQQLPFEKDRLGRIVTDDHLRVGGHEGLYALGDCACPRDRNYPQLAQVAEQQGEYLGQSWRDEARRRTPKPFHWHNRGFSSYIGQGEAVGESSDHRSKQAGAWAYQQWRSTIWSSLLSSRNRILVPLDRMRAWMFGRDLSKF